jgi:putative transposase
MQHPTLPTLPTSRKTFECKLQPTAEQERTMACVVCRCRERYNAVLLERQEAWCKRDISITLAGQSAHLPVIKQERVAYQDIHSHVLQDVLTRLDRAFQAFFRRVNAGETPEERARHLSMRTKERRHVYAA